MPVGEWLPEDELLHHGVLGYLRWIVQVWSMTDINNISIDYCQKVIDMCHLHLGNYCAKSHRGRGFMPYERTRQIEMRFQEAVRLIAIEPHNARQLAAALMVSTATVQRLIAELRRRGYSIRSVHDASGWRYELLDHHSPQAEEVSS